MRIRTWGGCCTFKGYFLRNFDYGLLVTVKINPFYLLNITFTLWKHFFIRKFFMIRTVTMCHVTIPLASPDFIDLYAHQPLVHCEWEKISAHHIIFLTRHSSHKVCWPWVQKQSRERYFREIDPTVDAKQSFLWLFWCVCAMFSWCVSMGNQPRDHPKRHKIAVDLPPYSYTRHQATRKVLEIEICKLSLSSSHMTCHCGPLIHY